jgi:hypothetical protein
MLKKIQEDKATGLGLCVLPNSGANAGMVPVMLKPSKTLLYLPNQPHKSLSPISELDLKTLTKKLTVLLCLLTGQRCQTITKLDINLMQELPGKFFFTIGEKLKTAKPGKHLEPIELQSYTPDENLCAVSHLKLYLSKTREIRDNKSQLLISYIKPHKP